MNSTNAMGLLIAAGIGLWPGDARSVEPAEYRFDTYHVCEIDGQARIDEIVDQFEAPIYDSLLDSGLISSWGWQHHHTGGRWRRWQHYTAASTDELLKALESIYERLESRQDLYGEKVKLCSAHDDYVWKRIAGESASRPAGAVISEYFACGAGDLLQADRAIAEGMGPDLTRRIKQGQLVSWGWFARVVGGVFQRQLVVRAADEATLLRIRSESLAGSTMAAMSLDRFCTSADVYLWETGIDKRRESGDANVAPR